MSFRRFLDSAPTQTHELSIVNGPRVVRNDATGDLTTVVERKAERVVGSRGPRCLIFNTDLGFTRLWDYPENWLDLGDQELLALAQRPRRSQSA